MRRRSFSHSPLLALVLLVLVGCSEQVLVPSDPTGGASGAPRDRYIVVMEEAPRLTVSPRDLAAERGLAMDYEYANVITGFAAEMSDAEALDLASDPRVRIVERDQVFTIDQTQSPTPSWGLDRVDQRNLPGNNSFTYSADSIQVDTPRNPSTTVWATPAGAPWQIVWGQFAPPTEGRVATARAWQGSQISADLTFDWCSLASGGPDP